MSTFEQIADGERFRIARLRGHKLKCCDCGLVHTVDFYVVHVGKGHAVELRARRDEKETRRERRNSRATKIRRRP